MPNATRILVVGAALPLLVQACSGDATTGSPAPSAQAARSALKGEEPALEPCSTEPRKDWKSFYYESNHATPLDPSKTASQLDVDDAKVVDALNATSLASVEPLKLPKPPDDVAKTLADAASKVAALGKKALKDAEYAKEKLAIYGPVDGELLDRRERPTLVDEKGLPGWSYADIVRPPQWPGGGTTTGGGGLPPPFVDLRAHPAACRAYVEAAAAQHRQRVYRNLELSQVHVEKVCLDPGKSVHVVTSMLESTVDTIAYVWDPVLRRAVASNDDAVHGAPASSVTYTNAGASSRCYSAIVMNQRPMLAGRTRVTTDVRSGATVVRHEEVEVQLRTFPEAIDYAAADVSFEVAATRYTDLPSTPTTLPLALFRGDTLVGFDYDSGVGPAAKITRARLGTAQPTRAVVLGRSVEARDFTYVDAYLDPGLASAFRPFDPFTGGLVVDTPPEIDPSIFPPSTSPPAPPVGYAPVAPGGRVDLVLDDASLPSTVDGDADGVGAETEAQLCTCDPVNRDHASPGWYAYCTERSREAGLGAPHERRYFADTDHDGFTDREETFGVELDQDPRSYPEPEAVFRTIALPLMGADALHKDLFIEIDFNMKPGHPNGHMLESAASWYLDPTTGARREGARFFRADLLSTIDRLYAAGARADLRNPSGLDGIRVHLDVGSNPILTDAGREAHCAYACGTDAACLTQCSDAVDRERFLYRQRAFGAWGGGGTLVPSDSADPASPEFAANMAQFCSVAPWYGDICPPGPGKVVPPLRDFAYESNQFFDRHRMRYFRYGLTSPYAPDAGQAGNGAAFGSGLGGFVIAHETGHTLGLEHEGHPSWGSWNCKPHYFSQMNYAYSYDARVGFSSADPATSTVLDPASVPEQGFTVSGLTPEAITLMQSRFPFAVDASRVDASGDGPANVDWNMSASYEPGTLRAPATFCKGAGEGVKANSEILTTRADADRLRGGATPALARVGSTLFAFYVDQSNNLRYRHGQLGPKSRGSCASQRLGTDCMSWSDEIPFVTSSHVGGVSVARWGDRLVLAYTVESAAHPGLCEQRIASSSAIASDGSIAGWTDSAYGRLVQCRDVEASVLPVDASVAPSGRLMGVFALSWDGQVVWIKSASPTTPGSWSEDRARDATGAVLRAATPPAVAVWPAADYDALGSADWSSRATACAVFPTTVTRSDGSTYTEGRFHCLDRATARWVRNTSVESRRMSEKPSLAFHVLRRADGEPVDAAGLRGQIWLGYVPEGPLTNRRARLSISMLVHKDRPPTSPDVRFAVDGAFGGYWDPVTPGSGIRLFDELGVGATKALVNWGPGYVFLPFADGSFQATLKTGNDFQVMEAGLCRKIRSGEDYCQGPDYTAFRY